MGATEHLGQPLPEGQDRPLRGLICPKEECQTGHQAPPSKFTPPRKAKATVKQVSCQGGTPERYYSPKHQKLERGSSEPTRTQSAIMSTS